RGDVAGHEVLLRGATQHRELELGVPGHHRRRRIEHRPEIHSLRGHREARRGGRIHTRSAGRAGTPGVAAAFAAARTTVQPEDGPRGLLLEAEGRADQDGAAGAAPAPAPAPAVDAVSAGPALDRYERALRDTEAAQAGELQH